MEFFKASDRAFKHFAPFAGENPQAIRDAIKLSDLFETDYIDIDTLPVENRKSVEGYKEYAKKLNAVGAEVKKAGKKLLYHPHAL